MWYRDLSIIVGFMVSHFYPCNCLFFFSEITLNILFKLIQWVLLDLEFHYDHLPQGFKYYRGFYEICETIFRPPNWNWQHFSANCYCKSHFEFFRCIHLEI